MTDEQLQLRLANKRMIAVAFLLLVLSGAMFYYRMVTDSTVQQYNKGKQTEVSLTSQVASMQAGNSELVNSIEQGGKELVSFSDDKLKYINLASSLAEKHNVRINKLSVSDVWGEGQMAGMTSSLEVLGELKDVQGFVSDYCDEKYTNRVNVISCRPAESYAWAARDIDGKRILTWFDVSKEVESAKTSAAPAAKAPVAPMEGDMAVAAESEVANQEDTVPNAMSIEGLFMAKTYKVYLEIDFLGRK